MVVVGIGAEASSSASGKRRGLRVSGPKRRVGGASRHECGEFSWVEMAAARQSELASRGTGDARARVVMVVMARSDAGQYRMAVTGVGGSCRAEKAD